MKKKILVIVTNHGRYQKSGDETGLWLAELTHFYDLLAGEGYEMDFVTPAGGKVPLDPRSLNRFFLDKGARVYYENQTFMKKLEETLSPDEVRAEDYAAIYYTGGHGTMWDFPDNQRLQELSQEIYESGGIVSAVCHGSSGLLNIKLSDGRYLVDGKRLTGYSNFEEVVAMKNAQVPFSLEDELKKKGANYKKGWLPLASFAVADGRLITGQNPNSTKQLAEAVVKALRELA
jgi:putative intracellular protease/amidase